MTGCGHVQQGKLGVWTSCDWRGFLYGSQKEKRGGLLAEGGAEMEEQLAALVSKAYESEDRTGSEITVPFKWFHDTPDCHSRLEADAMTDKAFVRKWTKEIGEVQTPFVDKASVDMGSIPLPRPAASRFRFSYIVLFD